MRLVFVFACLLSRRAGSVVVVFTLGLNCLTWLKRCAIYAPERGINMKRKHNLNLDETVVNGLKPYLETINLSLSSFVRLLLAQVYAGISGAETVVDLNKPVEDLTPGDIAAIMGHFMPEKPKVKNRKRVVKKRMISLTDAMTDGELKGHNANM